MILKSSILKEVLALVADKFSDHFGDLEPFHYAITRKQALTELEHFNAYFFMVLVLDPSQVFSIVHSLSLKYIQSLHWSHF